MKILFCIVLSITVFSCVREEKKENILPENKMREVMWDMIRADQYVSDFLLKDSTKSRKEESVKLYEQVFQLNRISRDQFRRSLSYYSSRPDLFRPIIDSLAARKTELPPPSSRSIPRDSAVRIKQSFQHKFLPKQ